MTNCFSTGTSLRGFGIGRGFADVRQIRSMSLQAIHWALPKPALQNCLSLFYSVWRLSFEMDTEVAYMCICLMQTADFRDFLSLLNLDRGATHSAEEKQRSSSSSWRRNFVNTRTIPTRGTVPAFVRCWFLFYLFSYLIYILFHTYRTVLFDGSISTARLCVILRRMQWLCAVNEYYVKMGYAVKGLLEVAIRIRVLDVRGSVHHSIIHKENPTKCNSVSKFYFIFT